jgi:hypothetical protein
MPHPRAARPATDLIVRFSLPSLGGYSSFLLVPSLRLRGWVGGPSPFLPVPSLPSPGMLAHTQTFPDSPNSAHACCVWEVEWKWIAHDPFIHPHFHSTVQHTRRPFPSASCGAVGRAGPRRGCAYGQACCERRAVACCGSSGCGSLCRGGWRGLVGGTTALLHGRVGSLRRRP